jgi:hypothetical protein
MNDDDKLFNIGWCSLVVAAMLAAVLQVAYRIQRTEIQIIHKQIIDTQQIIAKEKTKFASMIRFEILGNIIKEKLPKSETINFNKSVDINNLPIRKQK